MINYIDCNDGSLVLELLEQRLLVAGRVELHDFQRIQRVDLVNVLLQFVSGLGLDLLDLLEATLLDEGLLGSWIVGEGLGELVQNVVQDLSWAVFDEGLEGTEVGAHLEDAFECLLRLLLEVLGAGRIAIEVQQQTRDVLLGQRFRMVGSVASHLP